MTKKQNDDLSIKNKHQNSSSSSSTDNFDSKPKSIVSGMDNSENEQEENQITNKSINNSESSWNDFQEFAALIPNTILTISETAPNNDDNVNQGQHADSIISQTDDKNDTSDDDQLDSEPEKEDEYADTLIRATNKALGREDATPSSRHKRKGIFSTLQQNKVTRESTEAENELFEKSPWD